MTLLQKYKNTFLTEFNVDKFEDIIEFVDDANPWDIWRYVGTGFYDLNFSIQQKKQLFLELIEYYMKKGLLRFEGEAILSRDEYIDEDGEPKAKNVKSINFDKNASVDEIITWFDECFPTEEMAQKQNQSYEHVINIWMYVYPPYAYWFWKDPEDPEDEGEWYKCD